MPGDLLRAVPFLAALDEEDLARVAAATVERHLAAGPAALRGGGSRPGTPM